MTAKTKIWIDDIRKPPDNTFAWCIDYNSAIWMIRAMMHCKGIDYISFDHDLGEEKSGYDIAKFIVENHIPIKEYKVHSANPVGRFNIEQLLNHYGYKKHN